jgi:hypothetical protein
LDYDAFLAACPESVGRELLGAATEEATREAAEKAFVELFGACCSGLVKSCPRLAPLCSEHLRRFCEPAS